MTKAFVTKPPASGTTMNEPTSPTETIEERISNIEHPKLREENRLLRTTLEMIAAMSSAALAGVAKGDTDGDF